eukprot:CAMPEP_0197030412 /NCGR_PEP_ID=MMETSP1384-20130603/9657_1 /TAXON_ID=29189 /ORGANISM="Ammonia sp." /LENGTH=293 /DNA_ID=CAMNT_0042459751 /DNA_START=218 /DNA_END=1096 /DNA_ORIENTATION=+
MSEGLSAFHEDLQSTHPNSFEYLSHIYLSLSFFSGIFMGYVLDFIVHSLGYHHSFPDTQDVEHSTHSIDHGLRSNSSDIDPVSPSKDANSDREQRETNLVSVVDDIELDELERPLSPKVTVERDDEDTKEPPISNESARLFPENESTHLIKTSLITALAIALHNFPEGLATFVSTLANPTLGVSIAMAIAIHNIPEGVAVAMPVYFATRSKWKAFSWAFLSGIAEPIGGLVGYAIINHLFSETVFGVLFGFTGGIMVYISIKELLPTARKRDQEDKYTTILVFLGFLVMDVSL